MARALVVEEDEGIRWALSAVLEQAAYDVETAASRVQALALIAENTYQIILTDSFADRGRAVLDSLRDLLERARPTPVAIMTAWNISQEDIAGAGFAFMQAMPFDVDELLAQVAAAINLPLTRTQERQAEVVRRYFTALSRQDWDGLMELCAPDVTYVLPAPAPFAGQHVGRDAFRAYSIETFDQFPGAQFNDVEIYASPSGLASRYRGVWPLPDGSSAVMSGAVYFEFDALDDERIRQIGVHLNDERLRDLLRTAPSRES